MHYRSETFLTGLGWAGVAVSDRGITRIILPKKSRKAVTRELGSSEFAGRGSESGSSEKKAEQLLSRTVLLLQKYFSGEAVTFDLPVDIGSYTGFQQAAWRQAAMIPYGNTRSYAWIAERIRRPKAARAVGQAMGANPVPIIVPCHRVIASAGTLCGFAGGLAMKKKLLELEAAGK